MSLCKYFLEGRCRFGQNCKFEHSYDGKRTNQPSSLKQICKLLEEEVLILENGKQWPLTCFVPYKDGVCFPGWVDVSPEEVRWSLYSARETGTVDQCLKNIQQLYQNAEARRNEIKNPTSEVYKIVQDMSMGRTPTDPSAVVAPTTTNPAISTPSANFRFEVPSGGPSSGFGGFSTPTQATNTFTSGLQPGSSVFSTPTQPVNAFSGTPQSTNVFGPNSNTGNIFSSPPSTNVPNIFGGGGGGVGGGVIVGGGGIGGGSNGGGSNAFAQNIFSNAASSFGGAGTASAFTSVDSKNIFQNQQQNTFSSTPAAPGIAPSNPFQKQQPTDPGLQSQGARNVQDIRCYSKMEDLSENEKQCFMAPTFEFGKIPMKAPPLELC